MVLKLAQGPEQALEAVAGALDATAANRRRRPGDHGEASPGVPLFVLLPEALDEAEPLAQAVHAGWHYVARRGSLEAAVELGLAEDGALEANRVRTGRRAQAVLRAVRRAEADHGDGETFDVRILRIPPLHVEALWLAGANTDLFLPLDRRRKPFALLQEARARRRQKRAGAEPGSEASRD